MSTPGRVLVPSPEWRFVVAFLEPTDMALSSATLTFLDRLATVRKLTFGLNLPAVATMDVPSDNPEVNILRVGGGNPFLWYNNRILYGFRREGANSTPRPPGYDPLAPWVIRYSGIIGQLEREAHEDQPVSHLTAYDPWGYWLLNRPVVTDIGTLLPKNGRTFYGKRGSEIAVAILGDSLLAHGPLFADWGQTAHYGGTIQATDPISNAPNGGWNIPQGMNLGAALQALADTGSLDIVLTPIYDLVNRPGLISEVSIFKQAGSKQNGAIFGWDLMPHSLSALDLLHDGTQQANRVVQFTAKGNAAGTTQQPAVDTAPTFGQYWLQQNLQGATSLFGAELLALAQAELRRAGKDTLTFDPTPERSPVPWNEYFVGDEVPVYASRARFGEDVNAGVVDSHGHWTKLQRIYTLPIDIGDDQVETVTQILTTGPFF